MSSTPKTQANDGDVQAFLDAVEHDPRRTDSKTVVKMMEEITGETPVMWGTSIVGFGAYPMQYANGKTQDWPIVGIAPRKASLVLYILPGFTAYDDLMERLGKHKTGRSCLYIKRLSDVDTSVLKELITQSVDHMRKKYPPS